MGTTKNAVGYLAMTQGPYAHTLKDYQERNLPYVYEEYGVRTRDGGVLNFGKDKQAAINSAAGEEVVSRHISDWLPISGEG